MAIPVTAGGLLAVTSADRLNERLALRRNAHASAASRIILVHRTGARRMNVPPSAIIECDGILAVRAIDVDLLDGAYPDE